MRLMVLVTDRTDVHDKLYQILIFALNQVNVEPQIQKFRYYPIVLLCIL